jgi:hypothetical protein
VLTLFVASPTKADSYNIEQLGAPDFCGDFTQSFGASGDSFADFEFYISGKDTYRRMIQPSELGFKLNFGAQGMHVLLGIAANEP